MYLTTKNIPNSKPIAINTATREVIRLVEDNEPTREPIKMLKNPRLLELIKNKNITEDELEEIYKLSLPQVNKKEIKSSIGEYMVIPKKGKNQIIYLGGQTGSGKSTWIGNYLAEYKKIYPERKIYLFSDVTTDPLLDKYGVLRIKLNDNLVTNPIRTEELAESLSIFDDIDSINDKHIKLAINTLYDAILKKGSSHDNIDLIVTSHALADYKASRNLIINAHYIVFFKGTLNVEYVLKRLGLQKKDIQKIQSIQNSRYIAVHKNYPMFYVSAKEIGLL